MGNFLIWPFFESVSISTILLTRHCSSVLTHKSALILNKLKWLVSRTKALQKVSTKTAEAPIPRQVCPGSGTISGLSYHPKASLCGAPRSHEIGCQATHGDPSPQRGQALHKHTTLPLTKGGFVLWPVLGTEPCCTEAGSPELLVPYTSTPAQGREGRGRGAAQLTSNPTLGCAAQGRTRPSLPSAVALRDRFATRSHPEPSHGLLGRGEHMVTDTRVHARSTTVLGRSSLHNVCEKGFFLHRGRQ